MIMSRSARVSRSRHLAISIDRHSNMCLGFPALAAKSRPMSMHKVPHPNIDHLVRHNANLVRALQVAGGP